ncbi:RHS repeat-associated core domain-containing protein [Chitinophaga sp. S165]|uniref:RHS repeat-associated core domain-containing protein n=1 Tax=Chitinophaga sp. S165 TaxID=2135462 RepID=UPI000D959C15|nr:RHS repeat-associated core domain-containing protein [Chitinophaga sp. S165]PWV56693.1 RHS repeat-associated protein [Chitinophaga sp. S165]
MRSIYAKVSIMKVVVLSVGLLASLQLKAFNTIERYQNQLQGAIKKGDVLTVKDEKFESSYDWSKIHNASVNNLIKFSLYRESGVVLDKAFSCEVDLKVEYWPQPNQDPLVLNEHLKLKIDYNLTPGTPYQDAATYSFMSGYRVRITVNDITSAELGTDLPATFQINSQVIVERSYDLDASEKLAATVIWPEPQTTTSPEVSLIWNKITGAEEYDLEWTFIDELSENGKKLDATGTSTDVNVLKQMFRNNATRVTVQREEFKISLVHYSKYLILRMRSVRYDDKGIRLEEPWQYDQKNPGDNVPVRAVITLANEWHQNNLNWQYDAVYSEDGKKKEVVNYFDGTLRNRQTVSVNNADKKAVVQETIYDEFGRPLAKILPSPENESILKYYGSLHKKDATTDYTFRDVYGDAGACIGSPKPLASIAGAGRYYSPNNQFKSLATENKYIPDAEGYPFAVTRYTPDNTNRVSVQGGVGKLFQPGVDQSVSKASRYYYSEPQSWELNRMFGNDVGFADHYLKNMVIDGNGQMSITYLDASGRTIATALAGESPDNVDPLPSKPVAKEITEVVLEPAQFRFDESKLKIYATGTHMQTVPGPVRIHYNIDRLIKTYAENGVTICSNCYYEMDVLITDDCNRVLYKTTEPLPVGSAISNCNNGGAATGEINANFDLVGVYYVNFELRLTEAALLSYTEDYIRKNTNLKSEWSFINDALLGKDFLSCFNDCATCKASLGDLTTFTSRIKAQLTANGVDVSTNDQTITDWINGLYASLASQCAALRASCVTSPCEELSNLMKQDVSPGGQYALFDAAGNALEKDINVLYLNWRKTGRFPVLASDNALYIEERIELPDGKFTSPYDVNFTLAMLVQYWKPEWATRFLPDHPEYCALQFCNDNSNYLKWDEQVRTIGETIADIPQAVPGGVYSESDPLWLVNKDPFFLSGGKGHGYYNEVVADLNDYTRTQPYLKAKNFTAKTLPQFVSFMLYCSNKDGNTNQTPSEDTWNNCARVESCRERELEWAMFRDRYFELKEKYYTALRNTSQYCGSICQVGTPVRFPNGNCIDKSKFVIERGEGGLPNETLQYKVSYQGLALDRAITVGVYYPAEYSSVSPAPTVQIPAGQTSAVFYVWKNVPASMIVVRSTDCALPPSGDPVFVCKPFDVLKDDFSGSWFNDDLTQKASIFVNYNGTPLLPGMFITAMLYRMVDGVYVSTQTITASSTENRWTFNDISGPVSGVKFEVLSCDDIPNTPPTPACNPAYVTKISRAGNLAYEMPDVSTDPATLNTLSAAQLAIQVNANCEAQADNWMQQMEECLVQAIHCSNPDDLEHCAKRNQLRAKLIEVCKLGGDVSHPMGASTLPSGKATAEGYKSFDDVITGVLGVSVTDLKCNSYLLDAPAPYETKQQLTSVIISSTNAAVCAKLTTLQNEFTAAGGQGQFYDYLKTRYGAAMDISSAELQMLQMGCTNCRYLLAKPVKLPVFLDPPAKGCITENEYAAGKTALTTRMGVAFIPGVQNYETIFVNYMNSRFGFTLSYGGYLAYEKELVVHPDALLCNRPVYSSQQPDQYQCMMDVLEDAVIAGRTSYLEYIEEIKRQFRKDYIAYCGANRPKVLLTTLQQIYHYTLYYYDQAGNLVRTVPPEGVHLLDDGLSGQADLMRKTTPSTCTYNGVTVSADKNEAYQKLSPLFTTTSSQSMEMWLSAANGGQVTATLPGKNIMFNACLAGPFLNFDVYNIIPSSDGKDADIVLTGHTVADMRQMLPLPQWTHVVIQGAGLNQGGLTVYVNGKRCPVGPLSEITPCLWEMSTASAGVNVPENLTALKHLRLYNRLLTASEIAANAAETCMDISPAYATTLAPPVRTYWGRFNIPEAGAPGTIGGTTNETRYTPVYPEHTLTTSYAYQSLNKVEAQNTPDGGMNRFWYDRLGRIVASQNAEQKEPIADGGIVGRYSYSIYDDQNRIIETGEKAKGTADLSIVPFLSAAEVTDFISVGGRYKRGYTHYDVPLSGPIGLLQTNLRNRISWVESSSRIGGGPAAAGVKTYYSYDQIGNVKSLWQYIPYPGFTAAKRIDYKYDLVSGKVDKLRYQVGEADQFLYAYEYDSENRVTKASSGTKTTVPGGWEILDPHTDAVYRYYLHGPLARTELGDKQLVQGIDYSYTLQGWLKGVNGNFLQADRDMGLDGVTGSERFGVGRDAYAYSLDYYNGDYKSIGGTDAISFRLSWLAGQKTEVGSDLFNGNISRTTIALKNVNEPSPVGYSYRYDQLNRLKAMRQHPINIAAFTWRAGTAQKAFMEDVTYDGNGNILTYGRNGSKTTTNSTVRDMDDLSYVYSRDAAGNLLNNRLQQVDDKVTTSPYAADLKNGQSAGNYKYDNIGNLLSDDQEQISKIAWNYSGKIESVESSDPANPYTLNYFYDANGNRAVKSFKAGVGPGFYAKPTFYVRDAQGNVLATYDSDANGVIRWKEQYLYGSSRLGAWNPEMLMVAGANSDPNWSMKGNRSYELTNHLGNVLATISDKRVESVVSGAVDHYEAEVLSAQDYYPFGMLQPDRQWRLPNQSYRYGFNGKENDNEVKGEGNQQDYGMRVYDPRLGKFLSVDPLTQEYPWYTPYQFAGNKPIKYVDRDGEEESDPDTGFDKALPKIRKAYIQKINNMPENQRGSFSSSLSTAVNRFYMFSYSGRAMSARLLGRWMEGKGGYDILSYKYLSSTFSFGVFKHNIYSVEKSVKSSILDYAKKLTQPGSYEKSYYSFVNYQQGGAILSDMGTAMGSYNIYAVGNFIINVDKNGKKEVFGDIYYTFADKYQWKPGRGKNIYEEVDHDTMLELEKIGAKPFYLRAYFQASYRGNEKGLEQVTDMQDTRYDIYGLPRPNMEPRAGNGYALPNDAKKVSDYRGE